MVSEISPYEADLDWSELTEPDELTEVIEQLGQAVAKVHCVSDTDSDQTLVDFQTEEAIVVNVLSELGRDGGCGFDCLRGCGDGANDDLVGVDIATCAGTVTIADLPGLSTKLRS